ncbi:MAG: hypothetical protein J0H68_02710 [Sphingobacteriia bacterium]|nr:hypothetical protein [Sphingobacteriia bacterium]
MQIKEYRKSIENQKSFGANINDDSSSITLFHQLYQTELDVPKERFFKVMIALQKLFVKYEEGREYYINVLYWLINLANDMKFNLPFKYTTQEENNVKSLLQKIGILSKDNILDIAAKNIILYSFPEFEIKENSEIELQLIIPIKSDIVQTKLSEKIIRRVSNYEVWEEYFDQLHIRGGIIDIALLFNKNIKAKSLPESFRNEGRGERKVQSILY